jgi:hypothetical protein
MEPDDALTMWTAILLIVVVSLAWALSGCAPAGCVKPIVDLPEPVLPAVSAVELSCLTDAVYLRLAERDVILQSALRECRAVVEELTE